jgi:NAD(P)-dependent dehydrogenase (short-subunit alcohol dehydrogenase family)
MSEFNNAPAIVVAEPRASGSRAVALLAERGLRVGAILPGLCRHFDTAWGGRPISRRGRHNVAGHCASARSGREGTEVAEVVTFLASDRAPFITAADWRVDGGLLGMPPVATGDQPRG